MSLSTLECVRLSAVLEDMVDQLIILGHIMKTRANTVTQGSEEKEMISKLTRDWQYILKLMSGVQAELQEQQSFNVLLRAVEEEEKRKAKRLDIINRDEIDRERLQILMKQRNELQEMAPKGPDLDGLRVILEDQLKDQEVELRLERQKSKRKVELQIQEVVHQTRAAETFLENQLKMLHEKMLRDERVHEEIKTFLFSQHKELQQEQQRWLQCSQQIEQWKQQQLDDLHTNKMNNLEMLHELSKKYRDAEQLVMEFRYQKEKLRRQHKRDQAEKKSAVKIQAWWRGCMVRRGIGPGAGGDKGKKGKSKSKKKK